MDDFLTRALAERRSLKQALRDLRAKYQSQPSGDLAKMIERLEAEIEHRASARRSNAGQPGEGKPFMTHQSIIRPTNSCRRKTPRKFS